MPSTRFVADVTAVGDRIPPCLCARSSGGVKDPGVGRPLGVRSCRSGPTLICSPVSGEVCVVTRKRLRRKATRAWWTGLLVDVVDGP